MLLTAVRCLRISVFLLLPGVLCAVTNGRVPSYAVATVKPPPDEAMAAGLTVEDFKITRYNHFPDMDMVATGSDQFTTESSPLSRLELTQEEYMGRNTWMLWCGGNEGFWDWLAGHSYGTTDLLKLVDFGQYGQWPRWETAGLIREPGTTVPLTSDEFGFNIPKAIETQRYRPDPKVYGYSSGIIGLRIFPNPNFNDEARRKWSISKYYNDPAFYQDQNLVRPYRVGMSCAFCHVGPHPLNPPANPEFPEWQNLSNAIGAQYLRTRAVFGNGLKEDSFVYHVIDAQPPGTIDTSLVVSDNINNPNTMNAIWEIPARLDRSGIFIHRRAGYRESYLSQYSSNTREISSADSATVPVLLSTTETLIGSRERPVPRILLDGSDSIGAWGALARVYLNIGTYWEEWIRIQNTIVGFRKQEPFKIKTCDENSIYWQATKLRMDYVAKFFLKAGGHMRLKDAPGGKAYLTSGTVPWDVRLSAGRKVFAQNCIACHSSKQPSVAAIGKDIMSIANPVDRLRDEAYHRWAIAEVEKPEFWQQNYLATDERIPVTISETNAKRAVATNAIANNMWSDFSSDTYKHLSAVGTIKIWNPYIETNGRKQANKIDRVPQGDEEDWKVPGGGRGYYRPASLVGLWATAPFLHNNSLGIFNNDPSVKGRMAAFNDAIYKLLTIGKSKSDAAAARWDLGSDRNGASTERLRTDHGLVWRTPQESWLTIPGRDIPYLIMSTTGIDYPIVINYPWAIPVGLLVVALVLLLKGTRKKWMRLAGYTLVIVAFISGYTIYILAGKFGELKIGPIPEGTPVDLLANFDPATPRSEVIKVAYDTVRIGKKVKALGDNPKNAAKRRELLDQLGAELMAHSKCPDLSMDRGHYFAWSLTKEEREELIALLKTF